MPYRWNTFPINPDVGLVENIAALRQGVELPGSAEALVNFEPSIDGGYRRINGYTKFGSAEVTGTGQVWGVAIFDSIILAARNDKVFTSADGNSWTQIATGRTQTNKQRYIIINLNGTRKIIGVDGANYPYSWDGTNFVNINGTTDINNCTHVVEFKDHVFYSAGDLVTFSVPFDETDFTVADGAGNFRVKEDVTGMIVFRERLFIFTENTISVLDGDSQADFRLTSVSEDVGCIAEDTIQEVAGDVAFLSNDGIRLLGATDRIGDFSNQVASRPIQETFNRFYRNYQQLSATVVRGKSQYRIFGFNPGQLGSVTDSFIGVQREAQNPLSFQWSKLKGFQVYSIDSKVVNGSELIVFVGAADGYVYVMESGGTFDGSPILATYWTPHLSITDPRVRKTFYNMTLYISPESTVTGTVSPTFDFDVDGTIQPPAMSFGIDGGGSVYGASSFGSGTYGGISGDTLLSMPMRGSGDTLQLKFTFGDGSPFVLDAIMLEYAQEDRS